MRVAAATMLVLTVGLIFWLYGRHPELTAQSHSSPHPAASTVDVLPGSLSAVTTPPAMTIPPALGVRDTGTTALTETLLPLSPTAAAANNPDAEAPLPPNVGGRIEPPLRSPLDEQALPSLKETEAIYATDGIWPRTPDRPVFFSFAIADHVNPGWNEPATRRRTTIALPPAGVDIRETLRRMPPPPAFGVHVERNEHDNVITNSGNGETPAAAFLIEGRPPIVPVPRPNHLTAPTAPTGSGSLFDTRAFFIPDIGCISIWLLNEVQTYRDGRPVSVRLGEPRLLSAVRPIGDETGYLLFNKGFPSNLESQLQIDNIIINMQTPERTTLRTYSVASDIHFFNFGETLANSSSATSATVQTSSERGTLAVETLPATIRAEIFNQKYWEDCLQNRIESTEPQQILYRPLMNDDTFREALLYAQTEHQNSNLNSPQSPSNIDTATRPFGENPMESSLMPRSRPNDLLESFSRRMIAANNIGTYGPAFVNTTHENILFITGTIESGHAEIITAAIDNHNTEIIALSSPGGAVGDALAIAEEIRRRGISTLVPESHSCSSSCIYIFMGGQERRADGRLFAHQLQLSDDYPDRNIPVNTMLSEIFDFTRRVHNLGAPEWLLDIIQNSPVLIELSASQRAELSTRTPIEISPEERDFISNIMSHNRSLRN